MNAIVHPLKRKKPGRKKGPPTKTATFRMSEGHREMLDAKLLPKERRAWIEKRLDETPARRNGQRGGRPKSSPERKPAT